jgi:hypothetical protein
MAVTIDGTTFSDLYLKDQPFGYDEQDVRRGQTARKWAITGLMSGADWLDLQQIYNDWRDAKIVEDSPADTGVVGAVVTLSMDGAALQTWTSVDCWFSVAPTANQAGVWLDVSFELVDANQSLDLIQLAALEEDELLPDYGTVTIGTSTLTLKKPINAYGEGPALQLTSSGTHYISGPLVVYRIKDIEGDTDVNGWNNVRAWYEAQIVAIPVTGSDFPITPPTATAQRKIVSGVPTDVYTVSIQLGEVL